MPALSRSALLDWAGQSAATPIPSCAAVERHQRATADRAGNAHAAAGLLGKTVDLAQPQSGPLADLFGREERLEHARQNIRSDTAPGIRHADLDELAAQTILCRTACERHRPRTDRQRPSAPHGVACIHCKIEHRQLELARINLDRAAPGNRHFGGDIAAQRSIEHVLELGEMLGEIDHRRRKRLPPRKGEQLARQIFAAIGCVRDHIEQAGMLLPGQIAPQARYASADDHQQVVEIVGDPAGQLSDRLQTLGLSQRFFRGFGARPRNRRLVRWRQCR